MTQMSENMQPRRREVDHTNRDARNAVSEVAARCGPMRARVAVMVQRAHRRLTTAERDALVGECKLFEEDIRVARTELVMGLMDAPRGVVGHSRVFDIEKALDNLEDAIGEVRGRLSDAT